MITPIKGDIWAEYERGAYVLVPTNQVVVSVRTAAPGAVEQRRLVMGAGVAKQALERVPDIARVWGGRWRPYLVHQRLIRFDTKDHFSNPASLYLIAQSARTLEALLTIGPLPPGSRIVSPLVGCGLGGLRWAEVEPVVRDVFTKWNITVLTKE